MKPASRFFEFPFDFGVFHGLVSFNYYATKIVVFLTMRKYFAEKINKKRPEKIGALLSKVRGRELPKRKILEPYSESATRLILSARSHKAPLNCLSSSGVKPPSPPFPSMQSSLWYSHEGDFPKYFFEMSPHRTARRMSWSFARNGDCAMLLLFWLGAPLLEGALLVV